ncbi:protein kinase domain-containing protein [Nocardioides jishulii]|uniref:non-specific serine/threonine protein kinase n=1 Tax=Nocardioides jishulii TaxID=2575440 RepID=A0A4U2YMX1_9ACTN|nr:protein kinase [Nocardioides jishulii]QCX27800.1 serine/threonine protein kinase [Nocardioides jishulii]TKI62607.1 serine/threonine protein kinase [Nocardioides jishulii]
MNRSTAGRRRPEDNVAPGTTRTGSVEGPLGTRRVLLERYEVGEVIGCGATAVVHRGRDLRTGRSVAIKVLHENLATDPRFHARFRREAQAVTGLRHPEIVVVHDAGYEHSTDASGVPLRRPFLVMELITGRSLRDVLERGLPTLAEALDYQLGVLSALEASHRAGIVHRDIKPANVMVTAQGAVKVVDFGVARSSHDPAATLTLPGELLGTPSYLAPEQLRGYAADARSDLYSAGCLLHHLLSGRPPFVGDDPVSVAYQHVHEEPARVDTGVAALDSVLARALAKERGDRFQDARSFRVALLRATRGGTVRPGPDAVTSTAC